MVEEAMRGKEAIHKAGENYELGRLSAHSIHLADADRYSLLRTVSIVRLPAKVT